MDTIETVVRKKSVTPKRIGMSLRKIKRLHFVGIGGTGMCGIAEVLLSSGYQITGSDLKFSEATDRLVKLGAVVYAGHRAEQVRDAQVVVISSAVQPDNPEVQYALSHGIPVIRRAEMLGELMRMKFGIAVAGTHGKTTTTSMIGEILTTAGLDPTVVVGGRVVNLQTHAQIGGSEYLVAEADEFDRSFLRLTPQVAVLTNIEADHLDCYKDIEDIKATFIQFANQVPFYGTVVLCADDANVAIIRPQISRPVVTYGLSGAVDFSAVDLAFSERRSAFNVFRGVEHLGQVALAIPGVHNVKNALAAIAVGFEVDIPWEKIKTGLEAFRGVHRRFEVVGDVNGILVVDDYAHHPTEIAATLAAARQGYPQRRRVAVFQPHLFTRTRDFFREFGEALRGADVAIVTDIYPSREKPLPGITGQMVADAAVKAGHKQIHYVPDKNRVTGFLGSRLLPGDLVITLGAGDIYRVGLELVELLKTTV